MSPQSNPIAVEFQQLHVDGHNFLEWRSNIKFALLAKEVDHAVLPEEGSRRATIAQKARALMFIRHHLMPDLKLEHLDTDEPRALLAALDGRFNDYKEVELPLAERDWRELRFEDWPLVSEYNSKFQKIVAVLRLCGKSLSEEEMKTKTLTTFHPSQLN